MSEIKKQETLVMGWLDPRNRKVNHAGVAFYNEKYGEYFLKIDEEPYEKQYFLRPFNSSEEGGNYRLELVIKRKDGTFLKRQNVGEGHSNKDTGGNVFIQYGSKFKTLVLYLKD